MEIPNSLKYDISHYCYVNNITDVDNFIIKLIRQGFTAEKYGLEPNLPVQDVSGETPEDTQEVPKEVEKPQIKTKNDFYNEG